MSDHLDRDTVERLLRGEDTGPPGLAALLTAASARPLRDDRRGEEAAVMAFREARSGGGVPLRDSRRPLGSRVLAVKIALVSFGFALAGGVAIAASPHLSRSPAERHVPVVRSPAPPKSPAERQVVPPVPVHGSPRGSATTDTPHARGHRHRAKEGSGGKPSPAGGPVAHPPKDKSPFKGVRPPSLKGHWPPRLDPPLSGGTSPSLPPVSGIAGT